MRVLLFDWTPGGHHPRYLHRFAGSLGRSADVVVAAADETLEVLAPHGFETFPLGEGRKPVDRSRRLGPQHEALAQRELDLFEDAVARTRPDHAVHMYGDPLLRWLVRRPPMEIRISMLLFFARAHYPAAFDSRLTLDERARAEFQRRLVRRWRRRADAESILMLDHEAAARASAGPGARVFWLPEPPVIARPPVSRDRDRDREGCLLYGSLAARKGLDLLADAVARAGCRGPFTLAGPVEPGFEKSLEDCVDRMRESGADVRLRTGWFTEEKGLALLARARCVVLPYPRHFTMSRVLLEAAVAGTPVVAHDFGLVGHLVREFSLGEAVDCTDPAALWTALQVALDPGYRQGLVEGLRRFASKFSQERFDAVIHGALGLDRAAELADRIVNDEPRQGDMP